MNILLLDEGIPPPDSAGQFIHSGIGQLLPAMMSKNRFLLKSSMADPDHLFAGLQEGLNSRYPALFWIFSPAPENHDVAPNRWPALNPLAHSSRAFPHFQFSPFKDGELISSKISIEHNPGPDLDWQESTLTVNDGEKEREIPYAMTWADWAFTTKTWRPYFQSVEEDEDAYLPLAKYLKLDRSDRDVNIPVIYRVAEDKLKKYVVGEEVVRVTESCLGAWKALREWSGTLTEYPEKLRHEVEREVSRKFEQEMEGIKEEYEQKIEHLETEHLEKIQQRLKEKLMQMAKEHNGNYKDERDE